MCNLKANKTLGEFKDYIEKISNIEKKDNLVIFPPSLYLSIINDADIVFGSQDISLFNEESSTGEVRANQIKSTGATYTIIGHSERRKKNGEDEYLISKKIANALENDLQVVYCIGETYEEKARHKTYQVLEKQIAKIFNSLNEDDADKIIIAYEPVWAIGNGVSASSKDIEEITEFIKNLILDYYEKSIKVLYGGSVNTQNISELVKLKTVDGFLVGKASLNAEDVEKMLKTCSK